MVRHVFFCILLALAAVGCDRQKDPFLRKVEKEADRAIRRLGEPNVRDPLFRVDKLIESETNRAVRASCYRILQDKLLAVIENASVITSRMCRRLNGHLIPTASVTMRPTRSVCAQKNLWKRSWDGPCGQGTK